MVVCVGILTLENVFLLIYSSNFEQYEGDEHLYDQYDYHNEVIVMHSAIKSKSKNSKHQFTRNFAVFHHEVQYLHNTVLCLPLLSYEKSQNKKNFESKPRQTHCSINPIIL